MEEIWDLVDEKGNKVGITWARKEHSKIPKGLYHPCVEVWVRVGDKLLVTRRHPDKSEGLKYDCPGGAVLSGESMTAGAVRELSEEVGIIADEGSLSYLGSLLGYTAYAASYLIKLDELPDIRLQASEVVGYKLVTAEELEEMREELTYGTYARYGIYKEKLFKEVGLP